MVKNKFFLVLLVLLAVIILGGTGYWFYSQVYSKERIATNDPLLKEIKAEGKIVIGTEAAYPPMESIDDSGNFIGMDIGIAKEIAADLGVKAEFRNIVWDKLFGAVQKGEVDMIISSITITPERAKLMDFSDPYFNAGQVVVVRKGEESTIRGVGDLQGRRVGVQIDTTSQAEAKKYTDPALVKSFENYDLAKTELLYKMPGGSDFSLDAIIIDYPAGLSMVGRESDLVMIGGPFTQEFYGIATQKDQKVLLAHINETIRRMKKEGEFQTLEEKWLRK